MSLGINYSCSHPKYRTARYVGKGNGQQRHALWFDGEWSCWLLRWAEDGAAGCGGPSLPAPHPRGQGSGGCWHEGHPNFTSSLLLLQPCYLRDWEMQVHFKIHGQGKKNLNGDGFAIWYTKDRMQPGKTPAVAAGVEAVPRGEAAGWHVPPSRGRVLARRALLVCRSGEIECFGALGLFFFRPGRRRGGNDRA